jgi:DNA anti-recombination protein RmuC
MPEDSRPATKQDLNELREQIRGQITEVRGQITTEVRGQIAELREQLVEQMRDMQTEVLRAFHDWAQPVEIKLRGIPPVVD